MKNTRADWFLAKIQHFHFIPSRKGASSDLLVPKNNYFCDLLNPQNNKNQHFHCLKPMHY